MPRLTPPTKSTFAIGILAIAAGILLHLGVVDLADLADVDNPDDYAFWASTAGGVVLAIGAVFKKV